MVIWVFVLTLLTNAEVVNSDSNLPLIIYLILMAGVIAFGFWASYRSWLRDKGEILKEIRKLKKEFEEE